MPRHTFETFKDRRLQATPFKPRVPPGALLKPNPEPWCAFTYFHWTEVVIINQHELKICTVTPAPARSSQATSCSSRSTVSVSAWARVYAGYCEARS